MKIVIEQTLSFSLSPAEAFWLASFLEKGKDDEDPAAKRSRLALFLSLQSALDDIHYP